MYSNWGSHHSPSTTPLSSCCCSRSGRWRGPIAPPTPLSPPGVLLVLPAPDSLWEQYQLNISVKQYQLNNMKSISRTDQQNRTSETVSTKQCHLNSINGKKESAKRYQQNIISKMVSVNRIKQYRGNSISRIVSAEQYQMKKYKQNSIRKQY